MPDPRCSPQAMLFLCAVVAWCTPLLAAQAQRLRIETPNRPSQWGVGTTHRLAWTYAGSARSFRIEVSRNAGRSWQRISDVANAPGSTQNFHWRVTGPTTASARLRVRAIGDAGALDITDANIDIAEAFIRVLRPRAARAIAEGSAETIAWEHNLGARTPVVIDVRRDADPSWHSLTASSDTTGSVSSRFKWVVDIPATDRAQIRIRSLDGSGATGFSTHFSVTGTGRPGALDTSFGIRGRVVDHFSLGANGLTGLAIDANGAIVAAGFEYGPGHSDLAVARYSADGMQAEHTSVDFHPGQSLNDEAVGVGILPDGNIAVGARTSSDRIQNDDFGAARVLSTLVPDPTFGDNGTAVTDFFGNFDLATGMALQPDGRIVVVGRIENAAKEQDFGLARYHVDGTLDGSFGTGGRVVSDLSPRSEIPFAVVVQPDGGIVVVGVTFDTRANELTMVRYRADGSLDPSFGAAGKVLLNGHTANPHAVALQPDGRIVVAGIVLPGGDAADFALWRFEASGRLDASFGIGGRVFTDFDRWDNVGRFDNATAIAVQPDGKIVVAGYTQRHGSAASTDFAVARYDANGDLDTGFGRGGLAVTDFFGGADFANAVAIQPTRGIIVGGTVTNTPNGSSDFGLARYRMQ